MMSSPGNAFVRANYLAVAVYAPLLAALPVGFLLSSISLRHSNDWLTIGTTIAVALALFVLPGVRAVRRLVANGHVIPPELVSERRVVSFVVTLFGGFGHFFFLITMSGALGIALAPEWPEEGKKIVGPLLAGLAAYFIALWCAEGALVGNGESDRTRASGSGAH